MQNHNHNPVSQNSMRIICYSKQWQCNILALLHCIWKIHMEQCNWQQTNTVYKWTSVIIVVDRQSSTSSWVACLTAVREVLGSNRAAGSCVYRTTTVIYSLGHELCAPFLQSLGQLSLLPYMHTKYNPWKTNRTDSSYNVHEPSVNSLIALHSSNKPSELSQWPLVVMMTAL